MAQVTDKHSYSTQSGRQKNVQQVGVKMIQAMLLDVCRSSGCHSRSQLVEHVQQNTVGANVDHTALLADAVTRQQPLHGKSTQGLQTHPHTHTHKTIQDG
jgi:hypothetical protein